jgi:hypothetical protein
MAEIPSSTTTYAENKDLYIYFQSLHTPDAKVKFKAFIDTFTQSFSTNWNTQTVFGRMDPIQTFQNTQRTISLTFKTTAVNAAEAAENLKKINLLTRMLYPTYDIADVKMASGKTQIGNALTMAKPPLMRVRFVNWIQSASNKGLIAAISGFEYSPDWSEEGVFDYYNNLVPKTISISCTLNILHEHDLGWTQDGQWLGAVNENKGLGGANFPFVTTNTPDSTSPIEKFTNPTAPVNAAAATANQLGSTSGNSVDRVRIEEEDAPIVGIPMATKD